MSKSSIDRLGDRLREDASSEADLRELTLYRQEFAGAYGEVLSTLRRLGLEPTGRPAKSTSAIIDKLKRESIRLTQMQDISGLRVVVADRVEQDRVVSQVSEAFLRSSVIDRRDRPSHGYRAVHVVVGLPERPVEIQVRTVLQHRWAELSEKLSDVVDPGIKYGGGPKDARGLLAELSTAIAEVEEAQRQAAQLGRRAGQDPSISPTVKGAIDWLVTGVDQAQRSLHDLLEALRDYEEEE